MSETRKYLFAAWTSLTCVLLALLLFLSLCWTAAADAQGAIAFVFYAPVLLLLLSSGLYLGRIAARATRIGGYGFRSSQILLAFIVIFYVAPFVGLRGFSDRVIGIAAKSVDMLKGR